MTETIVDKFELFERYSKKRSSILTREHSMEMNFLQEINVIENRSPEEETMYVCRRNVEN